MTIVGIDTVAVVVSNRRKALQWFKDALGLPVAYIGPALPNSNPSAQGPPDNPGLIPIPIDTYLPISLFDISIDIQW